ncbi:MAG TPA: fibronectin type III domain-containing protein, partial [Trebonia sp.]|nr:fibronectin type III domain-containing protein [Trebonia sp.]
MVTGIPSRPALANSRPAATSVRPFTVLPYPATVASGLTVAAGATSVVPVAAHDTIPPVGVTAVAVRVTVAELPGHKAKDGQNGAVALVPWTPPASTSAVRSSTPLRSAPTPARPPGPLVSYGPTGTTSGFGLVGVTNGALKVVNLGQAPVTVSVDVEGYAGRGGAVVPLSTPVTLSAGATMGAGQRESLPVAGVPAHGLAGLLVQLTANGMAAGQLRDSGSGGALLDYAAGSSTSGLALMSESAGRIALSNASSRPAQVSAVVVGYLSNDKAAGRGPLTTVTPAPVTSSPLRVPANGTVSVPVAGQAGIPAAGVAGAAISVSAALTGSGHSTAISVGLASSQGPASTCSSSAGSCNGFTVASLSGPASDGALLVHNSSSRAALVTLSAFGYLAAATVPSAPTAVAVKARGASAVLSWRPPTSGGSGITGYDVTVSPGGRHLTVSGRSSGVTISSLSRDVTSTFTVAAVNRSGPGAPAAATLVPAGTPAAPGQVTARADGRGRYLVKWTAAGGARVTGYTVTAAPSRAHVTVSASSSSAVVTGLAGGSAYLPCVTATSTTGATAQSCAGPLLVNSNGATAQAAAVTPGSKFTPVSPVRVMDTRNGTGGVTGPVASVKSVSLQVAGVDGVPSSGVTAVVMNVTVTQPTATSGVL